MKQSHGESHDSVLDQKIDELLAYYTSDIKSLDADLMRQIIHTSLRMLGENYDSGQLKLMTRAFKEMRYAYRTFNQYGRGNLISIFGSARTPETHPDYQAAKAFSAAMASIGWSCITGAGDGIMKAGLEGAERQSSFGLSIRLPFEEPTESLLAGDPKLISFRYFFTRKLMFLSHSNALAAFPGGVGTQDELFEALTLMQTGKASIVPIVLLQAETSTYWQAWLHYIEENLLKPGWIGLDDLQLFYIAPSVQAAVDHIHRFYRRYHSSRYVGDQLVIRMLTPLKKQQIAELNQKFTGLIAHGVISPTKALPEERDHLELPRLMFAHNRRHFGLLRALIDRINAF